MAPQAEQDLLHGILGVGSIRQQGARVAVNLIAMALAQKFEFKFTNHSVTASNEIAGPIVTLKCGRAIHEDPMAEGRRGGQSRECYRGFAGRSG
jgi:hypothetical protein